MNLSTKILIYIRNHIRTLSTCSLCLLAGLCWIGELMQCYHVHYVPVEPLSHSLFLSHCKPTGAIQSASRDQFGPSRAVCVQHAQRGILPTCMKLFCGTNYDEP